MGLLDRILGSKEVVDAETEAENTVVSAVGYIESLVSNIQSEIENATQVSTDLATTKAELLETADRYQKRIDRVESAKATLGKLLAVIK